MTHSQRQATKVTSQAGQTMLASLRCPVAQGLQEFLSAPLDPALVLTDVGKPLNKPPSGAAEARPPFGLPRRIDYFECDF